jgi:uncharacterized protein YbcV (DUF1398 family)
MTANWKDTARATLEGSESDTMTFPQSVRILMEAGFDGYAVDFRRSTRAYYMPTGEAVELETERTAPVAEHFDAATIKEAIRDAQALVPAYTYRGFCAKVAGAGCAGYVVSLLGKRVLYYGRSGETHTESFPGTQPGRSPERDGRPRAGCRCVVAEPIALRRAM